MTTSPELRLVLGNKNHSSWSLRPWLLMRHAGVAFEERVFLFEEPRWRERIVALSPSRRVPALHHGDVVVWDSLAICEYVAELFPEAALWPSDRAARAIARAVSAEMHAGFANLRKDLSMDVTARVPRRTRSEETEQEIARVQAIWDDCRARYGAGGPFLFGRFSIADAMFAPVVWRFRTYDVPMTGAARAYYEAMLELAAMKAWERDAEAEAIEVAARREQHGNTPDPTSAAHCFAVVFGSELMPPADGYDALAEAMVELASKQPGFLGFESARGADGFGISVSYWDSLEAIRAWKAHPEHQRAQARGRESHYARYELRVCAVERGYRFERGERERQG